MGVVLVLVAVIEWTPGLREIFGPWNRLNAEIYGLALAMTGLPVTVSDATIIDPGGFRLRIVYGCTGVVPGLLIIAWVASLPQPVVVKAVGIASGLALAIGINLLRILAAFHVAVIHPDYWTLTHDVLGYSVVVISTAAFLIFWHRRATRGVTAVSGDRVGTARAP